MNRTQPTGIERLDAALYRVLIRAVTWVQDSDRALWVFAVFHRMWFGPGLIEPIEDGEGR